MITTAVHSRWDHDVTIGDLESAGLQRPCIIRWKIFTIPNQSILKRIGALGASDRVAVLNAGNAIFV